jgi:hypothetical protein
MSGTGRRLAWGSLKQLSLDRTRCALVKVLYRERIPSRHAEGLTCGPQIVYKRTMKMRIRDRFE